MDDEEWRDIPELDKYEVSSLGNVRNKRTQRLMKLKVERYIRVGLYIDEKKVKWFLVHRLVALAFHPNPENKKVIDHINKNKHDNRKNNIRWTTQRKGSAEPHP